MAQATTVTTRDRILTATIELFRLQGFNGTSLKQVSVAAKAPIGSIYHGFPGGKDDLAGAAIEVAGASYQQLFESMADDAGDIVIAVGSFFEGAAAVLAETGYLDLCPIGTIASEVASTNDALRAATERVFADWLAAITERFIAAGLERDAAAELGTTVIAALEGSFILARSARSPEPILATGRVITAAIASTVLRA